MKKIKTIFRNFYFKTAVITSDKLTRRLARKLFIDYMNENKYRYRIANDMSVMESGFQIAKDRHTNVYYDFSPDAKRIVLQSHFFKLETHQIPDASLLIAHLNNLLCNGRVKINFHKLSVYYEVDASASSILLQPDYMDTFHSGFLMMPVDFLWCFNQVLEVNEDPVVVIGEFMQKLGIEGSN